MRQEADLVLIGTGLAPLLIAVEAMSNGKRVALMNPDSDFFLEDSELPFPLLGGTEPEPWVRNGIEEAYQALSPFFPGAIEQWSSHKGELERGFYDPTAPHLRGRSFLILKEFPEHREIVELDRLGNALRKLGVPATAHEGLAALKRFPGFSGSGVESAHAISVPQVYDLDLERYRQGILQLVWDRLGDDSIFYRASSFHFDSNEVRFYSNGRLKTLRFEDRVILFWTPRIARLFTAIGKQPYLPSKVRALEQWNLTSREELDPSVIGVYEGAYVWSNYEGSPEEEDIGSQQRSLSVLLEELQDSAGLSIPYLREASFKQTSRLCKEFLNWDKYSVRSIRPRTCFVWEGIETGLYPAGAGFPNVSISTGCDGSVLDVARAAKKALEAVR